MPRETIKDKKSDIFGRYSILEKLTPYLLSL